MALSEKGEGFVVTAAWGEAAVPGRGADPGRSSLTRRQAPVRAKAGWAPVYVTPDRRRADKRSHCARPKLGMHLQDVAGLTRSSASGWRWPPTELNELRQAAQLHDLGKMAIPDGILQKADPLRARASGASCANARRSASGIIAVAPCLRDTATIVRGEPRTVRQTLPRRHRGDGNSALRENHRRLRRVRSDDRRPLIIGMGCPQRRRSPSSTETPEHEFDPDVVAAFAQVFQERRLPELLAS